MKPRPEQPRRPRRPPVTPVHPVEHPSEPALPPFEDGPEDATLLTAAVGVSPADYEAADLDKLRQQAAAMEVGQRLPAASGRRKLPGAVRRDPSAATAKKTALRRPEVFAESRTPDLPAGGASDARITEADAPPRRTLAARYEEERKLHPVVPPPSEDTAPHLLHGEEPAGR